MRACEHCAHSCNNKIDSVQTVENPSILWIVQSDAVPKYRADRLSTISPLASRYGCEYVGNAGWLKKYKHGVALATRSNKDANNGVPVSGAECYNNNTKWIVETKPKLVFILGASALEKMIKVKHLAIAEDVVAGKVFHATFTVENESHTCWVAVGYGRSIKDMNSTTKFKEKQNRLLLRNTLPKLGFDKAIPAIKLAESPDDIKEKVKLIKDCDTLDKELSEMGLCISLDVETTQLSPYPNAGENPKLLTVAITDLKTEKTLAFCVDHPNGHMPVKYVKDALAYYLNSCTKIVGHNFAFDLEWMHVFFGKDVLNMSRPVAECTSIATMIVEGNNTALSMAWLSQLYFGYNTKDFSGVDISDMINQDIDTVLRYNGSDTIITARLYAGLLQKMNRKQRTLYQNICEALRPTVAMQYEGFFIDDAALADVSDTFVERSAEQLKIFLDNADVKEYIEAHDDFSISSPAKVADLFTSLGFKLKKTATGKLSVSAASLEKYEDSPVVKAYQKCNMYKKASSTFADAYTKHRKLDGRVHPRFNLTGTKTLRYSSNTPNLQQVSKRNEGKIIRKAFCGGFDKKGNAKVLISNDFGALENLCIAIASRDTVMANMIQNDVDTHRYFAHCMAQLSPNKSSGISGIGNTKVVKGVRQSIKMVVSFPRAYGCSDTTIAEQGKVSQSIGTRLGALYDTRYSGIVAWQNRQYKQGSYVPVNKAESEQTGYIRRGRLSRNICLNTPIQHAGAMIVLEAISKLYYSYGMTLSCTVHDELTIACVNDPDIIAQCAAIQGAVMITPQAPWAALVPMVAEAEYGMNMLDMQHLADMHAGKLGLWTKEEGCVATTKLLDSAREFVSKGGSLQNEVCMEIKEMMCEC